MSQLDRVLRHLQKYGQITSWQAIQLYRITRLSAVIYLLKQKGYRVHSTLDKVGQRGKRFATYTLDNRHRKGVVV